MDCLSPINVKRTPAQGIGYIPVPCGKCLPCLKRRAAEWSFRINKELQISYFPKFITLTYDDFHLPINDRDIPVLDKSDVKAFLKRLRQSLYKVSPGYRLRYYLSGEYGPETIRPHYHAIILNVCDDELIVKAWRKEEELIGHIDFEQVTEASINYVTAYLQKQPINIDFEALNMQKPFSLMSKGIGEIYLKTNSKYHEKSGNFFVTHAGGTKQILPRYYKEKIFNDGQRSCNTRKVLEEVSKRIMAERERIEKLGNSVGVYQLTQREQYLANHIKKTKQRKL